MKSYYEQGITLLITVILVMVFTTIVAAVSGFVYKQIVLSQSGKDSAMALYAADTAIDCMIYADRVNNLFYDSIYNSYAALSLECVDGEGVSTLSTKLGVDGEDNECDGNIDEPYVDVSTEGCYTGEIDLSDGTKAIITYYTYLNNSTTQYDVFLRARGKSSSNDRAVERALEYSYSFDSF